MPHPDTKKNHDRALKGLIQTLWQPQIAKKGSKLPQKSKDSKRQKKKSYKMKVISLYGKPLKHISGLTLTLNLNMAQKSSK